MTGKYRLLYFAALLGIAFAAPMLMTPNEPASEATDTDAKVATAAATPSVGLC